MSQEIEADGREILVSQTPGATCTKPELGRLLTFYEGGALEADQMLLFEEHLLSCEFCHRELEAAFESNQLLLRNKSELHQHYAGKGEDFAAELAGLAKQRQRHFAFGGVLSIPEWLRTKRVRFVILPSAAIAVIALVLVLKQRPLLQYPQNDSRSHSTRPFTDSGSSTGAGHAPESNDRDARGIAPRAETPTSPLGIPRAADTESTPDPRTEAIEQRLPRITIPFTDVSTRGSDPALSTQDSFFRQGMTFYSASEFDSCVARLKEHVKSHPADDRAFMYLGSSLYMLGEFERAAQAFEQAETFALDGANPNVTFYRAAALIKLRRDAEARELLKKLIGNPNHILAAKSRDLLEVLTAN